jgi:predicted transcriptional regulator
LNLQKEVVLARFDRHVIRRIKNVLIDEGRVNMTNLATKANVQYSRLVKYVEWLSSIGAVQVISDGKFKEILITERGRELFSNF